MHRYFLRGPRQSLGYLGLNMQVRENHGIIICTLTRAMLPRVKVQNFQNPEL